MPGRLECHDIMMLKPLELSTGLKVKNKPSKGYRTKAISTLLVPKESMTGILTSSFTCSYQYGHETMTSEIIF